MDTKCLPDAGSEPVSLYEQGDQISCLFQVGSIRKISERVLTGYAAAQFHRQQVQFISQRRMGPLDLFTHTGNRLIQAKSRLHTDHHQVQSIWNSTLERVLSLRNCPSQPD